MDTPAAVRHTARRPALRRAAAALALVAGLGLTAPAAADAAGIRPVPVAATATAKAAAAVASQRPVVLQRIGALRSDVTRATAALAGSGLPATEKRVRAHRLRTAQSTLTAAALRARSARTMTQLSGAATLAERVAPELLPTSTEVLARGRAALDTLAVVRPDLEDLDFRASVGEANGFDVSTWAGPVRAGLPKAVDAEALATRVVDTVSATGTVTSQDLADLVSAESLTADATSLEAAARDARAALNGS